MWVAPPEPISSRVASNSSRVYWGRASMMSPLMLENPARLAAAKASRLWAAVWGRPRRARLSLKAVCTPRLSRFTPACKKPERLASSTVSGFASSVTSAPGAGEAAAMSRAACSGVRRLGVPPPKYTVSECSGKRPCRRKLSIRRTSASTYSCGTPRLPPLE